VTHQIQQVSAAHSPETPIIGGATFGERLAYVPELGERSGTSVSEGHSATDELFDLRLEMKAELLSNFFFRVGAPKAKVSPPAPILVGHRRPSRDDTDP
jgi:hypothetical protein